MLLIKRTLIIKKSFKIKFQNIRSTVKLDWQQDPSGSWGQNGHQLTQLNEIYTPMCSNVVDSVWKRTSWKSGFRGGSVHGPSTPKFENLRLKSNLMIVRYINLKIKNRMIRPPTKAALKKRIQRAKRVAKLTKTQADDLRRRENEKRNNRKQKTKAKNTWHQV